ncbi:hypothetical protein J5N97_028366 [Dioscorea zingiberensis]|uniref:Uncharacterized protein n=1 Tax=Dioscorea zingiberensis TaxID=325984 RepID=A0A9D5H4R0_9LILI|nr:hypothetical protein J5N97_028366 [Dioscorea zingiberensis]
MSNRRPSRRTSPLLLPPLMLPWKPMLDLPSYSGKREEKKDHMPAEHCLAAVSPEKKRRATETLVEIHHLAAIRCPAAKPHQSLRGQPRSGCCYRQDAQDQLHKVFHWRSPLSLSRGSLLSSS